MVSNFIIENLSALLSVAMGVVFIGFIVWNFMMHRTDIRERDEWLKELDKGLAGRKLKK